MRVGQPIAEIVDRAAQRVRCVEPLDPFGGAAPEEQILQHRTQRGHVFGAAGEVGEARIVGDVLAPERAADAPEMLRSEEHTSELQSLMRISYAVFCLKKKKNN